MYHFRSPANQLDSWYCLLMQNLNIRCILCHLSENRMMNDLVQCPISILLCCCIDNPFRVRIPLFKSYIYRSLAIVQYCAVQFLLT